MREAEVELELLGTLGHHAVTHALDLQLLLVALGHTDDHVVDESTGEAVQRAVLTLVVRTLNEDLSLIILAHGDGLANGEVQGSLRTLHLHVLPIKLHLDTGRDGDGKPANARH